MEKKEADNDRKWTRRAQTYDSKRFNYFRFMQKKVISLIEPNDETSFLDLGCGTGWAVRYFADKCGGRGTFAGIDIAAGMVEKARENAAGSENIRFYQASAEDLPLENDSVDTVICTNSFHHYRSPEKALAEVCRVLKPAGKIYILDVTADDLFMKRINRTVQKKEKEHVSFYSTAEYLAMFAHSGLHHLNSKAIIYPLKVHIAEKPASYK